MGKGDQIRGHQVGVTGYLMTIDLTRDEIWFLKALRAAGERGRIVSAQASRRGLARLVEMRYATEQPQSERKTLYIITDHGRRVLANAPQQE
jgi:DNA-binding MarR family transcriptional regulator